MKNINETLDRLKRQTKENIKKERQQKVKKRYKAKKRAMGMVAIGLFLISFSTHAQIDETGLIGNSMQNVIYHAWKNYQQGYDETGFYLQYADHSTRYYFNENQRCFTIVSVMDRKYYYRAKETLDSDYVRTGHHEWVDYIDGVKIILTKNINMVGIVFIPD